MSKEILLIGGAGFIGSRFCQLSTQTCIVADKKTGCNINITSPRLLLPRKKFSSVIFLAAEPNLRSVINNPQSAFKTMTQGLMNSIERYSDSHFVYVSSSMVYGPWTNSTMNEQDNCLPNNIYGQLKLLGEGIVKQFHNNWTIVRPSAVYGPHDNPSRVVNLFINKIQDNQKLTLEGADNLFDFTYVDDIVNGLQLVVDQKPQAQTYNITCGTAHTLEHMTQMLYKKLNVQPNFETTPLPHNYPRRGALGITKATNELGYTPNCDLSRGLDDTINKLTQIVQ